MVFYHLRRCPRLLGHITFHSLEISTLKLSHAWQQFAAKEREVLARSPTEGLMVVHNEQRFAWLGDSQVRGILENSKKKDEWVRWFLLLAAYSGARRSELASLTASDFKLCPDTGRNYPRVLSSRRCIDSHLDAVLRRGTVDGKGREAVLIATDVQIWQHN